MLSLDKHTRDGVEKPIQRSIESAAKAFARQATPPTFASALLANFLENVLGEYDKVRRRSPGSHSSPDHRADIDPKAMSSLLGVTMPAVPTQESGDAEQTNVTNESWTSFEANPTTNEVLSRDSDISPTNEVDSRTLQHATGSPETSELWFQPTDNYAWTFADEDGWAAMFLDAGFDINGGVFMPN